MPLSFRAAIVLSAVLVISACSDSGSSSSSTSNIVGWVGAEGLDNAQVIANQVNEAGQIGVDANDIYVGLRESTSSDGQYSATINVDEVTLVIARGQIADVDKDNNNEATQSQCQLFSGCTIDSVNTSFGEYYAKTTGFEWRAVVFQADDDSRNNVNSITSLAEAFAYQYDVKNNIINTAYTAYDIVLANSQVSRLLGVDDIIGYIPANLTQLDGLRSSDVNTKNRIRYGALIAAFQQLELTYQANNLAVNSAEFITRIAEEFASDEGQLYFHTDTISRELTQVELYAAAHDNLAAILPTLNNSGVKALASQVVNDLNNQLIAAQAEPVDTLTTAVAGDLSTLLSETEIDDLELGLEKTKLFVESLVDYENTLWTDGYQAEIKAYRDQLIEISEEHKDNLNILVAEFSRIQDYYVTCIIGGELCSETIENGGFADLEARKTSYDEASKILKLDDGGLTVSQALADLGVINTNNITESNAVDIYVTGRLQVNSLVLLLDHDYDSDEIDIEVPSSMRIYYTQKVEEARADLTINGYEIIWGDFQLYDESTLGASNETDLAGAFRIFYRGVTDPQDPNSEWRFNIENLLLSSVISDSVDENDDNNNSATIAISAQATNPEVFYPANKFASFNGFFKVNNANEIGDIASNLLTYKMGKESVLFGAGSIEVETVDFINALGEDVRYRFYPNELIEDKDDSNGNGNREEKVDVHQVELCDLEKGTDKVAKCEPKSRIYDKRDVQKTINQFWELGLFQLTEVDGRGTYFVDFPTEEDEQGCLVLQPLQQAGTFDGRLIEQQVLGLNSVRLISEISLENDAGTTLPQTLLDVSVVAPRSDKYLVNAAISHNYSATSVDENSTAVGTGTSVSVIRVSYDTSADFENSGSINVIKGGVSLTLGDASTVTEDQNITSFLTQTFDSEAVNYKIIEDAEGVVDRCILSVGEKYIKDPEDLEQVFYLNYRGVVYGTARQEGDQKIWTIRYIDGTWFIPTAGTEG